MRRKVKGKDRKDLKRMGKESRGEEKRRRNEERRREKEKEGGG